MAYTENPARRSRQAASQRELPLNFGHPDLNLSLVTSPSFKSRLKHFLFPLLCFWEYPFATFLDYNLLYAFYDLAPKDRVWYLAFAVYLSLALASYALLIWRLCARQERSIMEVYCDRWTYVFTAIFKGYEYYCFLALVASSGSGYDRVKEQAHWHLQDWPNALLLLLRAIVAVALLLTHHVFDSSITSNAGLDSSYYNSNAKMTNFLLSITLIQLAYTALRLLLLYLAFLISTLSTNKQYQCLLPKTPELEETPDLYPKDWRSRAEIRIQEVVEFCTSPKTSRRMSGAPLLPEIPLTDPMYRSGGEMMEVSGRPVLRRGESDDSVTTPAGGEMGRFQEQFYDTRESCDSSSEDQRLSTLMEEDEEGTNAWRISTDRARISKEARRSVEQALPSPVLSSAVPSSRTSSEQQELIPPTRKIRPQSSDTFGNGRHSEERSSE